MTNLTITAPTDGGNIRVIDAKDPANVRLEIIPDGKAAYHQWFYFRVSGARGTPLTLRFLNANKASYLDGWADYRAVASTDLENWYRVPTDYTDGELVIRDTPGTDAVYYAYFAPYPIERYRAYVALLSGDPVFEHSILGQTVDGEPMDLLQFGNGGHGDPTLWVIGRQHPGETMGSWWMEGFLNRLSDESDAAAMALRQSATLNIVPLVNIDGARRGHLRTNALGSDLNRSWAKADKKKSPETAAIIDRMAKTGCDFFLDVHGDEGIANNFIAAGQGVPRWTPAMEAELDQFKAQLLTLTPAFQTVQGYDIDEPGKADLRIAANAIAERFGCLSMTLEMPFKDATVLPDPVVGWSPQRCANLGATFVDAVWQWRAAR